MEKIITARHFHLREDGKSFVRERLAELEAEERSLTSARVVLDRQKLSFMAEVILHGRNIDIEADATGSEPEIAFDGAMNKAVKQLKKRRDKVKNHKTLPIKEIENKMQTDVDMQIDLEFDEEEELVDIV